MAEPVNPLLMKLAAVLECLGAQRQAEILGWIQEEMKTQAILTGCADDEYLWVLGEPDPMAPDELGDGTKIPQPIVIGILEWAAMRAVIILSFMEVEEDGKVGVQFYRNVVYNPKRTTGPLSHEALFCEIRGLLDRDPNEFEEPEPEPAPAGRRRAPAPPLNGGAS
jgi:hypothetical protein